MATRDAIKCDGDEMRLNEMRCDEVGEKRLGLIRDLILAEILWAIK